METAMRRSDLSAENSEKMCEAATLVRAAAEPAQIGEKVDQQIQRSARRLGWLTSRVREIWYGRARRIDAHEMDRLREVAAKHTRNADLLRQEYAKALDFVALFETRLTAVDPDFYSPEIGALRDVSRGASGTGDIGQGRGHSKGNQGTPEGE